MNEQSAHNPTEPSPYESKPQAAAPHEPTTFEESIKRLQELVGRLESGELSLEASLAAFEQGVALAREAQKRLDEAEARVDELLAVDESGRVSTRPMR